MIGRGELGFQLATTSRNAGILTPEAYSATIWALLLATLLGPYAFRLSMRYMPWGLEATQPAFKATQPHEQRAGQRQESQGANGNQCAALPGGTTFAPASSTAQPQETTAAAVVLRVPIVNTSC